MAEGLILEPDGVGRSDYDAVNAQLGLDQCLASDVRWHGDGAGWRIGRGG